jgi:glucose-1-phosphate cytidylyltransferase
MKVVILAGGLGTRLAEETDIVPKPMVEIGGKPILWHIMKYYAGYGFKEFYIALGYKGDVIKHFFYNYFRISGDISIDLAKGKVKKLKDDCEDWTVNLIETGLETSTGGRLKRLEPFLKNEAFMLTYGDGLSDVNLNKLERFHRAQKRLATITAVRPPARFGGIRVEGPLVTEFIEKPQIGEGWINGGFMVMDPGVFKYISGDQTNLEQHVLDRLSSEEQLAAYKHDNFWQCMDNIREKRYLEKLWQEGQAPWKKWE